MRHSLRRLPLFASTAASTACALVALSCAGNGSRYAFVPPSDGGDGSDLPPMNSTTDLSTQSNLDLAGAGTSFLDLCGGLSTTITGTVYAPNGIDPVSHALVYIPTAVNPIPKGVACDLCNKPFDQSAASTIAGDDGTFTLTVDNVERAPMLQFAVSKGRFRRVTNLNVSCGLNQPAKVTTSLPGNSTDGDIPNIAVGTGNLDHLDQVLVALGITEFKCLEGRKSTGSAATCNTTGKLSDLLTGGAGLVLNDYNMVFIGCAPGAYANYQAINVSTAAITQSLQAWTALGGRLFVTDNSYDYVSEAFPTQLTWQGAQANPWPVDGANVGIGTMMMNGQSVPLSVTANVDDTDLAAWLKVVGVMTSPMVQIQGFKTPWSVQAAIPMNSKQVVDATVPYTMNAAAAMADLPLTSDFKVNSCGKVVYSSYHTLSSVNAASLSAQEKILEYLMLDEAACTSLIM